MLRCVVKNSHHCSHGRLQSIRSFRLTPPFLWDQSGVNQWDSELSCAPFSLRLDPFYLLWVYHGLFHSWSNPCFPAGQSPNHACLDADSTKPQRWPDTNKQYFYIYIFKSIYIYAHLFLFSWAVWDLILATVISIPRIVFGPNFANL